MAITILICTLPSILAAQTQKEPSNWAELLGYGKNKKVIILHADDAGMCEEANEATIHYLKNDYVQSAAVMVPCPASDAMIAWAKAHPDEDVGVHLTLTSEWKTYRWGTVTNEAEVPGLLDSDGKMWRSIREVVVNASPAEVEKEARAQIDKFIAAGIQPGHIDTHMGTLYAHPEYVKVFFKLAEEYGIPANAIDLSKPEVVEVFKKQGYPLDDSVIEIVESYSLPKVDFFTSAPNGKSYQDKKDKFKVLIQSLHPGITEIIFHPSTESENLKAITGSWQQRVWEAQMFADTEMIEFFKNEQIVFTDWKEMMLRHKKMQQ
jgi:predicted glycoside hydrolase/deacetylase ChbG (UPF0249 family)